MDIQRIRKYFSEELSLSKGDLLDIENILSDSIYFQSLRFIYLKGWYKIDYPKFKSELDRMSIFISNREALFFFIYKEEFSHLLKGEKSKINTDKTLELIDAFFEVTDSPIKSTLEIENSSKNLATTDYLSFLDEQEEKKSKKTKSTSAVNISSGLITLETIVDTEEIKPQNESEKPQSENLITLEEEGVSHEDIEPVVQIDSIRDTEDKTEDKTESLIMIEEFDRLVAETLKNKETDTKANTANVSASKEETKQTNYQKEEVIDDELYNTIGSEEMSVLITQRLEESLAMLQELRRAAKNQATRKDHIIDEFLSKEIKPITLDKNDFKDDQDSFTLEDEESEDVLDEGFFTETLAKIYTKQGKYDKAYEIIKHLSLKVPNKNAYFVEQLDYLEKLISKKK